MLVFIHKLLAGNILEDIDLEHFQDEVYPGEFICRAKG